VRLLRLSRPHPPAPAAAGAALASSEAAAEGIPDTPEVIANLMFDIPETVTPVNFNEGAAGPGEIDLPLPEGWEDSEAAATDRQAVADAMALAGAGETVARELWHDIAAASANPVTTTQSEAMAELRRTWGRQTDAKIALARNAVAEMQQRYPGRTQYLQETGLGNSPEFVRKIVARASRRGR
jgi:hypothetical protein